MTDEDWIVTMRDGFRTPGRLPIDYFSTAASAGTHTHTYAGELLVADVPAGSPLVFADLLQNEDGTDLLYEDAE